MSATAGCVVCVVYVRARACVCKGLGLLELEQKLDSKHSRGLCKSKTNVSAKHIATGGSAYHPVAAAAHS